MNSPDFATARANMIDGQLRPSRVNTPAVLQAFKAVPRELFVPTARAATAYADAAQPLGHGREMPAPLVQARLIQGLNVGPDDKVLVVGGGTGYSAAVLAHLAGKVTLVEDDKKLATQAEKAFAQLGLPVDVKVQPLSLGIGKGPACQAILLEAPAAAIPQTLFAQLAEGGRLAAIRKGADGVMEAALYTRHGDTLFDETLFETEGHIHPAFAQPEGFVF
jgi:protein-L-isoaspartate(D-aspartate) O-methyltransferase